MKSIEERLLNKIEIDIKTGCWNWTGSLNKGHGKLRVGKKIVPAHRVSYELYIGPIPEGMTLDHFVCDNRKCVNPLHVRPASWRENVLRSDTIASRNLAKTKCPEGHDYDYICPQGKRYCKKCRAKSARKYRAIKRKEQ